MAVQANTAGRPALADQRWYARTPDEVAAALDVDPGTGLSSQRAAELLGANGPNVLPEEKPKPGWRRFPDQYHSYMQVILVGAAVVSLVIKEWSTGVLLLVLTLPRLIRPGDLPLPDCPQSRLCVCRDPPPRG